MAKRETCSPLKSKPVRSPGQSVQEAIDKEFDDTYEPTALVIVLSGTLFFLAVWQYFSPTPPLVWVSVTGVMFAGFLIWGIPRLLRSRKRVKQLKLGRDGERAVAEYLETLGKHGYRVLHDVPGEGFNLDHIVVTPHGIFTVETKTISKPVDRDAKVVYDGETVTVGGYTPDRDPIIQARAQATWLRNQLKDMTNKAFTVQPVVVYPNWYVIRKQGAATAQVWVMEAKELDKFIRQRPIHLSEPDIALVVNRLKLHVRGD